MDRSVEEIEAEAAEWLADAWDPDLTVGEWWHRVFEARYSLPTLPEHAYGRGYSRVEAQAVLRALEWNRREGRNPHDHWTSTLVDAPREGPISNPVRQSVAIAMAAA